MHDDGKFRPEDSGFTWDKYVAPAPILGAVLSTVIVLLLFGTAIFLCKHRRKRWQDELVPDPFIDRGSNGGWTYHRFLTSCADSSSNSMMNHIHLSNVQARNDPPQQFLQLRPSIHRDFSPPPRPPPTVTSINYGDQIAETLSTRSLDEREGSIHGPRGYRLHIPGSSYRGPSDTTFYHVSFFILCEESMS